MEVSTIQKLFWKIIVSHMSTFRYHVKTYIKLDHFLILLYNNPTKYLNGYNVPPIPPDYYIQMFIFCTNKVILHIEVS
jgi:hypothetical protein